MILRADGFTARWELALKILRDYLAKHIAALQNKTEIADYPFLGYDLGFQLQALHGELEGGEGEFGLRLLVNVGKSSAGSRVYAGAQSLVQVEAVRDLIQAISDL